MESQEAFDPNRFIVMNGALIEKDVLGIAAEVNRRWPNLRVQYLDPNAGYGIPEAPYQIIETCKDGVDRPVFQVWELNGEVLTKLEAINTHQVDLDAVIERSNRQAKRAQERAAADERMDSHEKAAAVIRSPKDTYKLNHDGKKITIRSNGAHDVRRD